MSPNWLDKKEYPFKSKFFSINGNKIHYIDEGIGETILFVHGTPSWSFDFRHIIKTISSEYRCIAYDHIGFGISDKPVNYDYSTINHANNLNKLIDYLELKNITLIVHDFGGPIGLNYAINNHNNIKQLIIFNTWLWSSENEPEFIKFKKILKSPLLPFLYKFFNFSAKFLLPNSFNNKNVLTKNIKTHYTKPFSNSNERLGTIGFAKSLLNDQKWFDELWDKKESIINKRTLFIWGMKDKFIHPKYLDKFKLNFNNHNSIEINDAGHFPQEEKSDLVAKSIYKWLNQN